jgi:hypothetical protein
MSLLGAVSSKIFKIGKAKKCSGFNKKAIDKSQKKEYTVNKKIYEIDLNDA